MDFASNLVRGTEAIVELCLHNLGSLLDLDSDEELDDDAKQDLATILDNLGNFPTKLKELKRKFDGHLNLPRKKRARKEIKDGELGSKSHAVELVRNTMDGGSTLDSLIEALANGDTAVDTINYAFWHGLARMQFSTTRLKDYGQETSASVVAESIAAINLEPGLENLANTYGAMVAGDTNKHGLLWWLKQIGQKIHVLVFAIQWNKYQGKGSRVKKQAAMHRIYLGEDGEMDDETKESEDFVKFRKRFRDDVKGTNRLLNAYKTVGIVVIFHPSFQFQHFRCSHTGPLISKLTGFLHDHLKEGNRIKDMEKNRRTLLNAALDVLCEDPAGIKLLLRKVVQSAHSMGLVLEKDS
ncbi:hypothetical protein FRC08_002046 [Ceratobasidium sp. 394]|nr:hypothetical protein FRC08_002046 [Ceratobasidium sp. 394]